MTRSPRDRASVIIGASTLVSSRPVPTRSPSLSRTEAGGFERGARTFGSSSNRRSTRRNSNAGATLSGVATKKGALRGAESRRRTRSAEEGKKLGGTLHGNRSALEVTRVPRHQNIGTGAQTRRHLNRVLEVGEREGECSTKVIAAQLHDVDDIEQIAHGGDAGSPAVLALDDVMNRRERVTGDVGVDDAARGGVEQRRRHARPRLSREHDVEQHVGIE